MLQNERYERVIEDRKTKQDDSRERGLAGI